MSKNTKPNTKNTKPHGTNGLDEAAFDAREMRRMFDSRQPKRTPKPQPAAAVKPQPKPAAQPQPKHEHRPCEHCGRLNTHGRNCRTEAACIKRRLAKAEAEAAAVAKAAARHTAEAAAQPAAPRKLRATPKLPKPLRKRIA